MKKSLLWALGLALAGPARALTYRADPAYSSARASLRHYRFFHPVASFEKVEGTFDYVAGKPEVWKASVTVSAASVNTGKPRWDRKLKSARALDAAGHPEITFTSTRASAAKDGKVTMEGLLTIRGVTHPARFELEVDNPIEPKLDGTMGLSAHGFISRRRWKIPAGLFFGDRVEITLLLQGQPVFP